MHKRSEGIIYLIRPCVCLCVDAYSGTTGYEAVYKQNQLLLNHKWVKKEKRRFSRKDCVREIWRENKRKSKYANDNRLQRCYCSDLENKIRMQVLSVVAFIRCAKQANSCTCYGNIVLGSPCPRSKVSTFFTFTPTHYFRKSMFGQEKAVFGYCASKSHIIR